MVGRAWSAAFANFCGVKLPAVANFKVSTWHHPTLLEMRHRTSLCSFHQPDTDNLKRMANAKGSNYNLVMAMFNNHLAKIPESLIVGSNSHGWSCQSRKFYPSELESAHIVSTPLVLNFSFLGTARYNSRQMLSKFSLTLSFPFSYPPPFFSLGEFFS